MIFPVCSYATVKQLKKLYCNPASKSWYLTRHHTSGAQLIYSWTICFASFSTSFLSQPLMQTSSCLSYEIWQDCCPRLNVCLYRFSSQVSCFFCRQILFHCLDWSSAQDSMQQNWHYHRRQRRINSRLANWQPTKWIFPYTGGPSSYGLI